MTDMARDISEKLDFLEISRKSMSQLQILLVETEVSDIQSMASSNWGGGRRSTGECCYYRVYSGTGQIVFCRKGGYQNSGVNESCLWSKTDQYQDF